MSVSAGDEAIARWEEQGCPWCRERWIYRSEEPREVARLHAVMTTVYRCARCGSYWIEALSPPHVVGKAEAEALVPDLAEREKQLGVDFPPSPR